MGEDGEPNYSGQHSSSPNNGLNGSASLRPNFSILPAVTLFAGAKTTPPALPGHQPAKGGRRQTASYDTALSKSGDRLNEEPWVRGAFCHWPPV